MSKVKFGGRGSSKTQMTYNALKELDQNKILNISALDVATHPAAFYEAHEDAVQRGVGYFKVSSNFQIGGEEISITRIDPEDIVTTP